MKKLIFVSSLSLFLLISCETPSKEKQSLYEKANIEMEKYSKEKPLPEEYEKLEISDINDGRLYINICYEAHDAKRELSSLYYEDEVLYNKKYKEIQKKVIRDGKILGFSNKTINNVLLMLDTDTPDFGYMIDKDPKF